MLDEADRNAAIKLMADSMEEAARYVGPGLHCIAGDKTALATRALQALEEHFTINHSKGQL